VGHADFQLGLRAGFNSGAALQAEKVGNSKPLDLDVLPDLVVHRATFQLQWRVALTLEFTEHSARTDGTDGELFEKARVGLE
jgi:hypothetical protein